MVMEYVDGVDLSRTIKDRGALPVAEACDYIWQAAIGLQHAHECGMVNRTEGSIRTNIFSLKTLITEIQRRPNMRYPLTLLAAIVIAGC
jgi:serine/threonine protein kinase